MSDEKVLKIGGDARGLSNTLSQVKRMLADVTDSVKRLNSESGKGILAGAAASRTATGPASPLSSVGRNQLGGGDFFQGLARSGQQALKGLTQALRTESTYQAQHVTKLRREVDQLSNSYRQLDRLGKAGLVEPGLVHQGRRELFEGAQSLGEAEVRARSLRTRQLQSHSLQGGAGKWGARYELAKEELGSMKDRALGALGIGQGIAQFGTAAVVGTIIGKTVVKAMQSGMQEAAVAPYDYQRREVQRSEFGSAAQRIRGGDYSLVHALQMVRSDPRMRSDLAASGAGGDLSVIGSGFGRGSGGGVTFNQAGHRTFGAASRAFFRMIGLDVVGGMNGLNRDLGDMPYQQAQDQLRMAQRVQEMRAVEFARLQMFQASTGSNISAMNAFGMGAGYTTKGGRRLSRSEMGIVNQLTDLGASDLGGGVEYRNSAQRFLDKQRIRHGLSPDELAGGYGSVESAGGFGTAQRYGVTAAIAQRGHLGGAGHILGTAAQTGDAGAFYASLNNLVGRGSGGLDVSAVSMLGQTVASTLANGNAPSSGLGLLGALQPGMRGGSAAEDMLNARFAGAGISAMGRVSGGSVDAYQSGSNLLSAIRALPQGSIGAQEYLSKLDPRLMFDIAGSGQVPKELQDRGITAESVRQFSRSILRRTYDRGIGASPNQGGRLNAVQQQTQAVLGQHGGSFHDYYAGIRKRDDRLAAIRQRGAFLTEAGLASSDLEGQSFARLEAGLGLYGTLTGGKGTPGRGVADYSAGSSDRIKEAKDAEMARDEHRAIEGLDPSIRVSISRAKQVAQGLADVGEGRIDIKNVQVALDHLVRAFSVAASQIEGLSAGGRLGMRR